MNHIQLNFEGTSVQRWEQEHGFERVIRNGCEYVVCKDWEAFLKMEEEERARARMEYIGQMQEEAYQR